MGDWGSLTLLKCHNLDLMISILYNTELIPRDRILGRCVAQHITNAPVRINLTMKRGGV